MNTDHNDTWRKVFSLSRATPCDATLSLMVQSGDFPKNVMVNLRVPEREVAAIMRHVSVETTRRYYAPGNVQRSADVIRKALGEGNGT